MSKVDIYTPKNSNFYGLGQEGLLLGDDKNIVSINYSPTSEIIANPERGFFQYTETYYRADNSGFVPLNVTSMTNNRQTAHQSLVFRYYVIEKYLYQDIIDQSFLDLISADFAAARQAGVKMIVRFSYSNSGGMTAPYNADPEPARVLSQIDQLTPVLNQHADVIDSVQAGFIGMWGEWYYTDNFGDVGVLTEQNWADRLAVINALLDGLDERIFVLVRYVGIKHRMFGNTFTARSNRLGIHNDAFLAPSDDYGTYNTFTTMSTANTRTYLKNQQNIPIGGESAIGNAPHSDWSSANSELAEYHWTFLNPLYHPDVLNSWGVEGRNEAALRLGYRIELVSGTFSRISAPTASYNINLTIKNIGYASPYRSRPVNVVFRNDDRVVTRTLQTNVKNWEPGSDFIINEVVQAPEQTGLYSLYLHVPDSSVGIAENPAYAIRFANADVWNASTGYNDLNHEVTIN